MLPSDDQTSIGSILVAMGALTEEQLSSAVREQRNMEEDVVLGKLLLASGVITEDQLKIALQSQSDLRSGKKHKRAMAQSVIAEHSIGAVIALATKIRNKSKETKERITGTEFPKVTVNGNNSDS